MLGLYEHNEKAYNNAVKMLERTNKAAIIHPTGTGKSFIGFKLCADNPEKTICWLSPSDYIFKTQLENLKKAADGFEPANIRFFTYARLMNMTKNEVLEIKPDYIILDEFHRCGAEMWGKGVDRLLNAYPAVPVLGLSATSIRYLDNRRDMSDELFDGNVASQMTLGEAVVRGILSPPTYVTTIYSYQGDVEKYQKRVSVIRNKAMRDKAEKKLALLRRTLENADGLDVIFKKYITEKNGKYLVFCASKEHMDEMLSHTEEWFGAIDKAPHIYQAYSFDAEANKNFADFKSDTGEHLKLLFCIDMLNEGVHVEDISGVILFRPTISPIIFKQQIGRAMSAGSGKSAVILDVVDNISSLYSIGAIQEEMQDAIDFYNCSGESRRVVNESFKVIDEVYDCRRLFDELEETLAASWDLMYAEAEKYYTEQGNLLPESDYVTELGYPLGQWLVTQRQVYRGTRTEHLSAERIKKLENIGMCWLTRSERLWDESYQLAKSFYEENGHLNVTSSHPALAAWIIRQRKKWREGAIEDNEYELLSQIGMVWEIENSWSVNYPKAMAFFEEHGHLDIPANYVTSDGVKLGVWYRLIKNSYRDGILSEDKRQSLEDIGMQWTSVKTRTWMQYYELAKRYYEEHDNLDVHLKYIAEDGKNLGVWISSQRYSKKRGKLTKEQVDLLEQIGMSWHQFSNKWQVGYGYAAQYYHETGNVNAAVDYINAEGFKLGGWLSNQRNKYKNGKLKPSQIKLLEQLGISWIQADDFWRQGYNEAAKYYNENNNLFTNTSYITDTGFKLGNWIANQRVRYKANRLTKEQIRLLEKIGMCWNANEEKWKAAYGQAVTFFNEHGHLNIKNDYVTPAGIHLGEWLASNRMSYRKGKLEENKADLLEAIGIVWNPKDAQWEHAYRVAQQYADNHGGIGNISSSLVIDGVRLYEWLRGQMRNYKRGALTQDKRQRLEEIGVIFEQKSIFIKNHTPEHKRERIVV